MKKYLLLATSLLFMITIAKAQVSYGLKAGLNMSKITAKIAGTTFNSKSHSNFYLTGYADITIDNNLSFQPGLSLQGKGAKSGNNFTIGSSSSDGSISLMYLEVPLNLVYYVPAGSGKVFFGAGPYLAYGLSINAKSDNESESGSFKDSGFNAFDAGVNFSAGYKLGNGFLINAGYSLALTNLLKDSGDSSSMKNRVFSVGIGYQF